MVNPQDHCPGFGISLDFGILFEKLVDILSRSVGISSADPSHPQTQDQRPVAYRHATEVAENRSWELVSVLVRGSTPSAVGSANQQAPSSETISSRPYARTRKFTCFCMLSLKSLKPTARASGEVSCQITMEMCLPRVVDDLFGVPAPKMRRVPVPINNQCRPIADLGYLSVAATKNKTKKDTMSANWI